PAGGLVKTFERFGKVPEKRVAPHFSVGDDVEAGVLLERDRLIDGAIFDLLVSGGRELAAFERLTRVAQVVRTQKAADRVAAWDHAGDPITTSCERGSRSRRDPV